MVRVSVVCSHHDGAVSGAHHVKHSVVFGIFAYHFIVAMFPLEFGGLRPLRWSSASAPASLELGLGVLAIFAAMPFFLISNFDSNAQWRHDFDAVENHSCVAFRRVSSLQHHLTFISRSTLSYVFPALQRAP
eukprot:TRINITY_DN17291_c0_g1_i1.p1 TRINITY_DN17291_c0_g1~~TRINITY_DN17291_c0_g1_i1.p1  ORF type:complete len:132 (-),score=7.08 TRINITY_DN17291_c0_g1_i1:1558-1953(-)